MPGCHGSRGSFPAIGMTKEQKFSVGTTFTHEILGSRGCKCHKDAAAVLALYALGNWVIFAGKFGSVCVSYPLKHQASFLPCVYLNPEFETGGGMSTQECFSNLWEDWTMIGEHGGFFYRHDVEM